MSINNLKYKFQHFLYPIAAQCDRLGIKASYITVFSSILSIVIGITVLLGGQSLFWLIPIGLFINLVLLNNLADILIYDFEHTSLQSIFNQNHLCCCHDSGIHSFYVCCTF